MYETASNLNLFPTKLTSDKPEQGFESNTIGQIAAKIIAVAGNKNSPSTAFAKQWAGIKNGSS